MERYLKIFLMAFIGLVFPCLSFASPDFYYYNNFLTGQSPFPVPSSVDLEADGTWEVYNPVQDNIGVVTSFSKEFMQGAPIPSAVPAYNLDLYVGKNLLKNMFLGFSKSGLAHIFETNIPFFFNDFFTDIILDDYNYLVIGYSSYEDSSYLSKFINYSSALKVLEVE